MPGVYDFTAQSLAGEEVPLKRFEGQVLLIVNTASACGFTPQYRGLEQLHREFAPRGFAVLGDRYHARTGTDATSFVIYPHRDRIGLLEDILHLISRESGLNLSSIHSRPDTKGGFRFYIEVEGHAEDLAVARCLAAMESRGSLPG